MSENIFEKLNKLNVNEHTEDKNKLTYLSWAWAWAEFKKACPNAVYEVVKFEDGKPYFYDDKTGYMVYTKVTVDGLTHEMWLPVMDSSNNAMKAEPYDYTVKNPNFKYAKWDKEKQGYYDKYGNEQTEYITKHVDTATMFDINKTIMRCLTKNLAMFGLGLYIYAGEDLPEEEKEVLVEQKKAQKKKETAEERANLPTPTEGGVDFLEHLIEEVGSDKQKIMEFYKVESLYDMTTEQFNHCVKALESKKMEGKE